MHVRSTMGNTCLATRPFRARIPRPYTDSLRDHAAETGQHYGLFFTTSGDLWCERINPSAQYEYLFRTDDATRVEKTKQRRARNPRTKRSL